MFGHVSQRARRLAVIAATACLLVAPLSPARADARLDAMIASAREAELNDNLRDAVRRAEEALRYAERTYGRTHKETKRAVEVLARVYRLAGRTALADAMERRLRSFQADDGAPKSDGAKKFAFKKLDTEPKGGSGSPAPVAQPRSLTPSAPTTPAPAPRAAEAPPAPATAPSRPTAPITAPPPAPTVALPPPVAAVPSPGGSASGASAPRRVGEAATKSSPATQVLDPAKFAEVPVFFGTNRASGPNRLRDGVALATFTSNPSMDLTLGEARVSVPRQGRTAGEIPRPRAETFWRAAEKEDPDVHFTMVTVSKLTREVFLNRVNLRLAASSGDFKNHAFVFVHGFNVAFDDAVFRTAQIAYDLDFKGAPFVFSWPTLEGAFGYIGAKDRALASRVALRDFLDLVSQNTKAERIHLIAHSMGTWPLLDVLREIAISDANRREPRFREVVLIAPDMDRENFAALAARVCPARDAGSSRCAGGPAAGMTFYATSNDRALLASVKLAAGIDRAGLFDEKRPFVVKNIDTIDVSNADTSVFAYNHSQPLERGQLLKDIGRLLAESARPPHSRTPSYEQRQTGGGEVYWKYQQKP